MIDLKRKVQFSLAEMFRQAFLMFAGGRVEAEQYRVPCTEESVVPFHEREAFKAYDTLIEFTRAIKISNVDTGLFDTQKGQSLIHPHKVCPGCGGGSFINKSIPKNKGEADLSDLKGWFLNIIGEPSPVFLLIHAGR